MSTVHSSIGAFSGFPALCCCFFWLLHVFLELHNFPEQAIEIKTTGKDLELEYFIDLPREIRRSACSHCFAKKTSHFKLKQSCLCVFLTVLPAAISDQQTRRPAPMMRRISLSFGLDRARDELGERVRMR